MQKFDTLLRHNQAEVIDKEAEVAHASVQWEACYHLVEQFKAVLKEAGEDYATLVGDEEIEAATTQPGIGPVLKMYYSNLKKLSAFAATKSILEGDLEQLTTARTAASIHLAALQAYSDELVVGKDALLMRPLPACNTDNMSGAQNSRPLLPPALQCAICSDAFPLWDVVLCSCQHIYHPWCAVHWFRNNVTCTAPECGLVAPLWYKSWGFGHYERLLNAPSKDQKHSTCPPSTVQRLPPRQLKNILGNGAFLLHATLKLSSVATSCYECHV